MTATRPIATAASRIGGGRLTRNRAVASGVAVLLGLAAIGSLQPSPSASADVALGPSPSSTPRASARPTLPATVRTTQSPAPTFGPSGVTTEARVLRVIDGDTIEVAIDGQTVHVRYIGMDAPETRNPNTSVQWMGPEATAANAALVAGRTVRLEQDVSEADTFGRLLRHVWVLDGSAWRLVNRELVRLGVASARSYPPDTRYDAIYAEAQAVASTSALGIWGVAPTPAPTSVPTPKPTPVAFVAPPEPDPEPADECHASYDPCLPIVGDLNCPDVRALGAAPVRVSGPDDYGLDRDGDGIGCE